MRREPALKLIIGYKLARAAASALGAVAGLVLVVTGLDAPLHRYAMAVHDHAVSALALWLSKLLVSAAESKHLAVVAGALALDAVVLLVEGWALLRGRAWGAWLVVAASGVLLPFEVVSLVERPAAGRVLLLLVNGAIVAWLVVHALRKRARPEVEAPP